MTILNTMVERKYPFTLERLGSDEILTPVMGQRTKIQQQEEKEKTTTINPKEVTLRPEEGLNFAHWGLMRTYAIRTHNRYDCTFEEWQQTRSQKDNSSPSLFPKTNY